MADKDLSSPCTDAILDGIRLIGFSARGRHYELALVRMVCSNDTMRSSRIAMPEASDITVC